MVAQFPVEDVIDSANCHILEVGMYLAAATVDGDAAPGGSSSSDQNSSGGEHDGRHSKVAQAQQEPDFWGSFARCGARAAVSPEVASE